MCIYKHLTLVGGSCEMKTDGVMEGYEGAIQNRYDVNIQFTVQYPTAPA